MTHYQTEQRNKLRRIFVLARGEGLRADLGMSETG